MQTPTRLIGMAAVLSAAACFGQDNILTGDVFPRPLIERMIPEPDRGLKFPAYLTREQRAAAECDAGLYRRAIYTLYGAEASELAALTRARARAALGEAEEALAALELPAIAEIPAVRIEKARLLARRGDLDEAAKLLRTVLETAPDSTAGHFELGRVSELRGDMETARTAYAWFVRPEHNVLELWEKEKDKAFSNAEEVVIIGRALDRWATLTGQYRDNAELHNTILNIFTRAYDVIESGYGPAHLAAAEYLLSHEQPEEATKELKAALTANPRSIKAMDVLARVQLDQFGFDAVDQILVAMRAVDPRSITADLLEARSCLKQRRAVSAEPILRRVLERQPANLDALGLEAAARSLQLDDAGARAILDRVSASHPDNATVAFEIAEQLGDMRQYPRAAAMYQIAIARAPWWTEARNGLGLLYTQSGDEDQALAVLDEAHHLDPFNLRTTNYLRLLDRLAKMASLSSPHFTVRFDAEEDPIIAPLMLEYLEGVNADITQIFDHQPSVTTLIEVFPTHEQFSVRTTGSPWIGTVGASTGRIIALVAPRDGAKTMGTYNWAEVLRHEYTHTVTLSATENRIPHWMTEGLAVYAEQSPLRWDWVPMLYATVTRDQLFPMDRLTWGFIRPSKPTDRQLAYAQSYWMCQYLIDTYSREAMLRLLKEFRAGKSQEQAFPDVLGRTTEEFYSEFVHWARRQVATWGYDPETSARYAVLREQGEHQVELKEYAKAADTWEEIAKIRPMDALPHQRLAGLYLTREINDRLRAREHLEHLSAVEIKDNRYAKRISRLSRDLDDLPAAIKYARRAIYTSPYDVDAHKLLLELAEKSGDAKLVEEQRGRLKLLEEMEDRRIEQGKTSAEKQAMPLEPG